MSLIDSSSFYMPKPGYILPSDDRLSPIYILRTPYLSAIGRPFPCLGIVTSLILFQHIFIDDDENHKAQHCYCPSEHQCPHWRACT